MTAHEDVLEAEHQLARRLRSDRVWRYGTAAIELAPLTGIAGTAATWHTSRFTVGGTLGFTVIVLAGAVMTYDYRKHRQYLKTRPHLEARLADKQEQLRRHQAEHQPGLEARRKLYREEITGVVAQYQTDSRRYRGIHNSLQTLIMTGSAATTTIAALDTGNQLTRQSVTLTLISFAITLAAMFTGYYKFRERSYFLQQTADSVEEEANASGSASARTRSSPSPKPSQNSPPGSKTCATNSAAGSSSWTSPPNRPPPPPSRPPEQRRRTTDVRSWTAGRSTQVRVVSGELSSAARALAWPAVPRTPSGPATSTCEPCPRWKPSSQTTTRPCPPSRAGTTHVRCPPFWPRSSRRQAGGVRW
ncbi:SLATT domain-containing protein [Streptomyces galilaeus]